MCKSKLSKTITANKLADVPDHAWEEDELLPALRFPLDLWRNICTYLKRQKINLFNNIYGDYYGIKIVTCTYQKSTASVSASAIGVLSRSLLSCFSVTHFDFQMHLFDGPGSSSINSTSRVPNSTSPAPLDIVKC
jgi:hypothetical protein